MNGWVRFLIRLHPRDFREERGNDVMSFVEAEAAEARRGGRGARLRFLLRTSLDLLGSALRLRLRPVLPAFGDTRGAAEGPLGTLGIDVRHGLRALRGTPVVTTVIVLTLGVGVGSTTAVFSVVDATLLSPLAYRDSDRLVQVFAEVTASGARERTSHTGGDLAAVRGGVTAFEEVAAVARIRQNLTGAGLPRQVEVGWTSAGFMDFLGVEPVLGRAFHPNDPPGTVVLGHALWVDHFGRDPGVVGGTIRLDGHPHTVVGVMPSCFRLHVGDLPADGVAVWKNPDGFWQNGNLWSESEFRGAGILRILGRLAPGATVEQATDQLESVASDVRELVPTRAAADWRLIARPLHDEVVRDLRPTLRLLAGAVLAVLLIACANVMGLLLVRARARTRELSLRRALGAGRGRLLRLLLTEGALLAMAGGASGLGLAYLGTRLLDGRAELFPRAASVAVDGRVLLFALALSMGATLLVALVPAWGAVRGDTADALRGGRREPGSLFGAGGSGTGSVLRNTLVVGQIAVSLVLMVATGLLTGSLIGLRSVEPGFRTEGLLTFSVSLPSTRYEWNTTYPSEAGRFLAELEDRLRASPGVTEAGVMWPLPLSGSRWSGTYEAGDVLGEDQVLADYGVGTPGYFTALGIPLLAGRLHRADDPRETVVVSRRVAERAWPGEGLEAAVGRTLRANPWGGGGVFEIIGVVDDVRQMGLRDEPIGRLYFDVHSWAWTDWEFGAVARAAPGVDPLALLSHVREVVSGMDPAIPVAEPATMETLLDRHLSDTRFILTLVGLFSVFAGALALVGLYGVVSYAVSRRRGELGIRMALGSARTGITRLVLGQGMRLVALGLLLGLLGAWTASRFLESWLYEVEPTDPATYLVVTALLAACATAATWIPAARAARTDPAEVLRSE